MTSSKSKLVAASTMACMTLLTGWVRPVSASEVAQQAAPSLATQWGLDQIPAPQLTGLQFTMIRQHAYPFHAAYSSPLSFDNRGSTNSTYTFGVYAGWEPIRHVQLYLDLEQFQGGGISNATGLASLTDGDSIRSGSQGLAKGPYIARKFLRLALSLSKATHAVERAQDQLPGEEADTHLEFKIGTLAVSDDFDKNRYANSTRSQFENWSLFNNTAWDFAADTRGYTGGAMLGYVSPIWSLRFGIYQMPQFANGQPLVAALSRARGQNLELTWAQPKEDGLVLRVLAYENIAKMGNYRNAIAQAQASGSTPDITADRRDGRSKYGFTLNLEQPLLDHGETGVFARLGWNDGRTESYAFTEVDRLVSFGGQLDGVHWHRADDRLGIAYLIGGLSGPHSEYLAAGGQGFVVGDGALRYGQERVLEAYYRFQPLHGVQISPDYQFITHPGYNKDRGPASVIGFRVHLEY